mmetsp:Transcript_7237/g.18488  ORF Transcript_7237/g.18488 Transcript_7237/m.18488 type:complete len:87 (+) Transcript_7237:1267-1527(+)
MHARNVCSTTINPFFYMYIVVVCIGKGVPEVCMAIVWSPVVVGHLIWLADGSQSKSKSGAASPRVAEGEACRDGVRKGEHAVVQRW